MGDGHPIIPALHLTLDGTQTRQEIEHRAARLALPAVALSEWCSLHSIPLKTARGWVQRGGIFPDGAVWQSGRDHLIRPTEPVPQTRSGPRIYHNRQS